MGCIVPGAKPMNANEQASDWTDDGRSYTFAIL
jgi:hypothetical protein